MSSPDGHVVAALKVPTTMPVGPEPPPEQPAVPFGVPEQPGQLPPPSPTSCQAQKEKGMKTYIWLQSRLHQERAAMEERHESMLRDLDQVLAFSDMDCRQSLSAVPSPNGSAPLFQVNGHADVVTAFTPRQTSKGKHSKVDAEFGVSVEPEDGEKKEAWGANGMMVKPLNESEMEECQALASTSAFPDEPELPPGTCYERFSKLIRGEAFEGFVAALIMLNAIQIAMTLQYQGIDIGHTIRFRTYDSTAAVAWPGATVCFEVVERIFIVIFTMEVIVRMVVFKTDWLFSGWNWLDFSTVTMAVLTWFFPEQITYNPTIVRLARFGKLLRIIRVMRSNSILACLKLLVASIQASVHTLVWSLCIVCLMQSVSGMFLTQMLQPMMTHPGTPPDVQANLFKYYGTFYRSMLTMFEVSFANWSPPCRILVDNVHEWWGTYFVIYRCMLGFAVLSVVQAVFIQQTIKSAQLDDDFMVEQKNREKAAYVKKLNRMFQKIDKTSQGYVDQEQFKEMLARNDMTVMMSTLEVEVDDLEALFKLLDDGDGRMNAEEFVLGLQRLKGTAKSLDVLMLLNIVRRLEAKTDMLMGSSLDQQPLPHAQSADGRSGSRPASPEIADVKSLKEISRSSPK